MEGPNRGDLSAHRAALICQTIASAPSSPVCATCVVLRSDRASPFAPTARLHVSTGRRVRARSATRRSAPARQRPPPSDFGGSFFCISPM